MERKANLQALKNALEKKAWDFYTDNNGEISFILGNREPATARMTDEAVQRLLHEVATR